MEDRMKVMNEIKNRISTHDCPKCGGPAYCKMEDGKSANNCWCMLIIDPQAIDRENLTSLSCVCKRCLKGEKDK